MRERPILFSGPMVRAILDDKKTQTRRVIKPEWFRCLDPEDPDDRESILSEGVLGDRLWVRETWQALESDFHAHKIRKAGGDPRVPKVGDRVVYRADEADDYQWSRAPGFVWRPSIFMPRWASRIDLEVTGERFERLQEISEADAKAEGVIPFPRDPEGDCWTDGTYRTAYEHLWGQINGWTGSKSWAANPWVWVIEFRRVP